MKYFSCSTLLIVGVLLGCTVTAAAQLPIGRDFNVERAEHLAKAALNDGDAAALRDLQQSARDGVAAAQYGLALFYFSSTMFATSDSTAGNGVALAYTLLQQSAAQSLPESEFRLCWFIGRKMNGPAGWPVYDPGKAAKWCEQASNAGIAAGDLALGQMALMGEPDDRGMVDRIGRDQIAIARLRRAALAGSKRAQYRLGTLLREKGSDPDVIDEAAQWLMRASAQAEVAGDDPWDGGWVRGPDWAAPPSACAGSAALPIPRPDLPAPAAIQGLADCDSEQLYYGIGRSADAVKARWCAYLERPAFSSGNGWGAAAFAGPSILAMIYANGEGVARNHALAEKFACEMGGAPAERTGRIEHLERMAVQTNPSHFDVCDDTTSGEMVSNCAARDGQIAEVKRLDHINTLERSLCDAQQTALQSLLTASKEFFSVQSQGETDQSGTGRSGFVVQQYELDSKAFLRLLDEVSARPLAAVPDRAASEAAARLAATFRAVMSNPAFKSARGTDSGYPRFGTVTAGDIGSGQQVWTRYRDAWVGFYAALYPNQSAAPIVVVITRERVQQLSQFSDQ